MSDLNYEELGFKCGIEIHQQLSTDTKLFCNCPVDLQDENPDHRVSRYLRAVTGETGEMDLAALVEAQKSREFVYNYYERNNCLVELDEEPPHEMDEEALKTALTFARMVDAEIPDEIQVMRKMVVDGSNTSGFQRTSMVGLKGAIDTSEGTVEIPDIELEEESAGIHERKEETAIYDLNRLGVPLIEIGTDASIANPDHAREVAMKLGMLLRSTENVRRGLGTIRQDVNVSIEDGSRVEIKGFQDVDNIDILIEHEVERQKNLVELGEELDADEVNVRDVTHVFEDTDNEIVKTVLENDGAVYGLKLPQLTGKMKQKISGERYVAKELVDYAKSRGVRGMIHTDEDIPRYGLEEEFDELEDVFDRAEEDVIAIIAAPRDTAHNAADAVKLRAELLYTGEIPEETRGANQDFTTSYSRPLPGSARMYPETDIPPVKVTDDRVEEIDQNLPETLEEREEKYAEEIGEEMAYQIVHSEHLQMFEKFREEADPKVVANIFTNILAQLQSDDYNVDVLEEDHFRAAIEAVSSGDISKGELEDVLGSMTENPDEDPEEIIEELVSGKASEEEIREAVNQVLDEKAEMVEEQGMRAQGPLMGVVMSRVEADGSTVSRILQDELESRVEG